ncbi:hypothetical protein V490_03943 [Pseudogymnoascus sp. VKM F-3557]|nr:hypothetical protein V490_03943 [Pseudogymnoascus sp. VKM F-3557]
MGEYGPARANRGEVDRDGWTMVVRWIAIQFPVGAFGASRSQLEPVEGQMLGVGVAWGEERGTGGRERGARRRCDWVAGQYSTTTGGALMALMLLYQQLYYCSTNFSTAYTNPHDLVHKGFSALVLDGGWLITCKKLMQMMHILNAETAGKGRAKMGHDGL